MDDQTKLKTARLALRRAQTLLTDINVPDFLSVAASPGVAQANLDAAIQNLELALESFAVAERARESHTAGKMLDGLQFP